jgi:hypothetical protein
MKWHYLTNPTEPVSYADAKAWLRLDNDDDQAIVTALISTAREFAETSTQSTLVTRQIAATWYDTDSPPQWGMVQLPRGPVVSIDAVEDRDGNPQDTSGFEVRRYGTTDYLYLHSGTWPGTVTYTAGTAVAPSIKTAILLHVAHLYANREATNDKAQNVVAFGLQAIHDQHRAGGYL